VRFSTSIAPRIFAIPSSGRPATARFERKAKAHGTQIVPGDGIAGIVLEQRFPIPFRLPQVSESASPTAILATLQRGPGCSRRARARASAFMCRGRVSRILRGRSDGLGADAPRLRVAIQRVSGSICHADDSA
jgi:hypothetical protein